MKLKQKQKDVWSALTAGNALGKPALGIYPRAIRGKSDKRTVGINTFGKNIQQPPENPVGLYADYVSAPLEPEN